VVELLTGGHSHIGFDDAVANFPALGAINQRAPNVGYTPWHIVEHLRITQWDMLRYIQDPTSHVSPDWPKQYWPAPEAQTDEAGFQRSPGHTAYRGIRILGNHNSYHVGEFVSLRQVMGSWPAGRG
jgi:hypothetical protein